MDIIQQNKIWTEKKKPNIRFARRSAVSDFKILHWWFIQWEINQSVRLRYCYNDKRLNPDEFTDEQYNNQLKKSDFQKCTISQWIIAYSLFPSVFPESKKDYTNLSKKLTGSIF